MPSEFWINLAKFQKLSDDACDWFIKSMKFDKKKHKLERQVCLLRQEISWRQSIKHLKRANRIVERRLNGI